MPATLPRPDATPLSDGKVKVYILAGQSNMVGFGYLQGSRPVYPSIYLSADPNIKIGRMPVGPSALLKHGVYQTTNEDAPTGAKVAIYSAAYKADTDYSSMTPAKETTVALGKVDAQLPSIDGPHTVVAKAFIDVPMSGLHEIHAGFEDSTYAIVSLEGKEVYRKVSAKDAVITPVPLEQGKRYPITITYMKGGSAAFWLKHIDLRGHGDLATLNQEGKYTWFADEEGKWTVRNDVTYWETRISKEEGGSGGPLTTTSNGKFIGPEVPFGYVMGTYHEEPVLLIESSMGNRALSFDFRPPSSGKSEEEKANEYCGFEYDAMVKGVHQTLTNIDKVVPNYKGQGYEIAGFVWFQGHKDKDVPKAEYEKHLVNLIQDLRKEFNTPKMPAVVATVGFSGMEMEPGHFMTWEAQMAVSDPKQHPEFAGNVASVDTRPFWRSRGESPTNTGYHYNHNAETYVLTGDALGRAMVTLHGGEAEPLTIAAKPEQHPDVETVFSDTVTGNFNKRGPHYAPEHYREMGQALKPILMEEMVPAFLESAFAANSRSNLKGIVRGEKPTKTLADIRSDLDTLIGYYDMAGIPEYEWKPFGPEMRTSNWSYYSFDPPEKQDFEKSDRYRDITFPEGMENWFATDFEPAKAGWKTGQAPFGRMGDKLDRRRPRCNGALCGCSEIPATLWEKEVLLMRQTFDIPVIKKGHAYRLILGGAGCDRSGEGFAIYINGKPLTEVNGGFFRYTGIRGAYLYNDILPEFEGGKVTIAVINFLRYTHFRDKTTYFGPHPDYYAKLVPPNGHVSLWMQEAKLSPATINAAAEKAED
ncbi:MAG: sialate O-acetylesterase [Verrucomicrobiales bacterium]